MPKLAPRPVPIGNPLREALADAIAKRREAADKALAAHAARDRALSNVEAARARRETADQAVTTAGEHHALVLIHAAENDSAAPSDKALRVARSEAESAADDLAAAESALNTLTEACAEPDAALQRVECEVAEAADSVLAERAPAILAAAEDLARSLSDRILELVFLSEVLDRSGQARRMKIISASADTSHAVALLNADPENVIAKGIEKFMTTHATPATSDGRGHSHLEQWHRTLEALKCDAEATLP